MRDWIAIPSILLCTIAGGMFAESLLYRAEGEFGPPFYFWLAWHAGAYPVLMLIAYAARGSISLSLFMLLTIVALSAWAIPTARHETLMYLAHGPSHSRCCLPPLFEPSQLPWFLAFVFAVFMLNSRRDSWLEKPEPKSCDWHPLEKDHYDDEIAPR